MWICTVSHPAVPGRRNPPIKSLKLQTLVKGAETPKPKSARVTVDHSSAVDALLERPPSAEKARLYCFAASALKPYSRRPEPEKFVIHTGTV